MSEPTDTLRDEETVNIFIEESLESLQRLERALVRAEQGESSPEILGAVFRELHTFKAGAAYLMFAKSRDLAHAAEGLLAQLRDSKSKLSADHINALLKTGDGLRTLVADIRRAGQEGKLDVAALINDLDRQTTALVGGVTSSPPLIGTEDPVASPGEEQAAPEVNDGVTEASVRVNVKLLDRIVHLATELVLARNQAVQQLQALGAGNSAAHNTCLRLSHVTADLQEQVMKTRMQPVARIFEKLPRVVRDLAQTTGKRVTVHIADNATEIDRALFEAVRDPILHIVRNAVDHGIETPDERLAAGKRATGTIFIRANHIGSGVVIEIEDDGRGMNAETLRQHAVERGILTAAVAQQLSHAAAIDLIFRPGFSTASHVTEVSGRGIGMDVVRTRLERSGGRVEVETQVGHGTTVRLHMPLTLAVIPALLVTMSGQRYAIPQNFLAELVYIGEDHWAESVHRVGGVEVLRLRGDNLPLVFLSQVLGLQDQTPKQRELHIVVVQTETLRYALVVDQVDNTEDIVVKPLRGPLRRHVAFGGVAVLGDGGVVLILDVASLGAQAGLLKGELQTTDKNTVTASQGERETWLVFEIAEGMRCAVPLTMVDRIEGLDAARIESLAGTELTPYREQFLRIMRLERALAMNISPAPNGVQTLIVFNFPQPIALAVHTIIDLAEVSSHISDATVNAPCVQGQAVLFERTTLLLDVYALVRQLAPHAVRPTRRRARHDRILWVETASAMRTALTQYVSALGLDVVVAESPEQAAAALRQSSTFSAAVVDVDVAGDAGWELLADTAQRYPHVHSIAWTYGDATVMAARAHALGAVKCINKLQREILLEALGHHDTAAIATPSEVVTA